MLEVQRKTVIEQRERQAMEETPVSRVIIIRVLLGTSRLILK